LKSNPGLKRFNLPDPDVRVKCQNQTIFISIWGGTVPVNSCDDESRQRAQDLFGDPQNDPLHDISNGGNFGIYVNASLLQQLASSAVGALPQSFDANGDPDPNGPIHITSVSVGFPTQTDIQNQTNHYINTIIGGYEDQSWPPVGFTVTLTDQLKVTNGAPDCTSTSSQDFNGGDIAASIFVDLFGAALSLIIPGFFLLVDLSIAAQIGAATMGGGGPGGGVGCAVFLGLPLEIPLPGPPPAVILEPAQSASVVGGVRPPPPPPKMKIQLMYVNVRADNRGLLTAADATPMPRTPAVEIVGPDSLVIDLHGNSTFGEFTAAASDFFGDLGFAWSGGGVASQNSATTRITFARGTAKPGQSFQRTVHVHVADVEGSTATASRTVTIFVSQFSIPAICKTKPWLQQCKPS